MAKYDKPPKGEFLSNADVPEVHVDPSTSSGKTEDVKPNSGSSAVPCSKEPAPPRGKQLPGSKPDRTGAGHEDTSVPDEPVSGF